MLFLSTQKSKMSSSFGFDRRRAIEHVCDGERTHLGAHAELQEVRLDVRLVSLALIVEEDHAKVVAVEVFWAPMRFCAFEETVGGRRTFLDVEDRGRLRCRTIGALGDGAEGS